jgi:lipopolysaccharide transport system ATP-binding protein
VILKVEGLSKKYHLGEARREDTLRDTVGSWFKGNKNTTETRRDFWALRDVSFEVKAGDRLGIIGRNGAGKSTLLKILSRIVEPTRGRISIHGRVASLLEVGTGFHPELTGRENIYLNGAILGMGRAEIRRKFDEIVEFAEVEKFLDTPVKRYSSGMYVRLAFAVAAHLEPEILIVDEVLAVGDAQFQDKCLRRIHQSRDDGMTVLLVSHNLALVQNTCNKGIFLDQGRLALESPSELVIAAYLRGMKDINHSDQILYRADRTGSGALKIRSFHLEDAHGNRLDEAMSGQDVVLVIGYSCFADHRQRRIVPSFCVRNMHNISLLLHRSDFSGQEFEVVRPSGEFRCRIPKLPLAQGTYWVGGNLMCGLDVLDDISDIGQLRVVGGDFFGTGSPGLPDHTQFLIQADWRID